MSLLNTILKLKAKVKLINAKQQIIFTLNREDIDESNVDAIYVYMKI